jgi:DNA-binding NarL/FixJ family response regulator
MMNGKNHTNGASNGNGARNGEVMAYLTRLGLEDTEQEKVAALLEAIRCQERLGSTSGRDCVERKPREARGKVGLYISEEQEVFKLAYQSFFESHRSIDILGVSSDTSIESVQAALRHGPDVFLLGLKALTATSSVSLGAVKEACPSGVGLVLLFAYYDAQGIRKLKEFSQEGSGGRAYFLKHNLDTPEQLAQIVFSVTAGRIIVDPVIMGELMDKTDNAGSPLIDLSRKDLEVLSWVARGYGDAAIASVLCRDVKKVERQVADIYRKLNAGSDRGDSRVSAALLYLKATGLLPAG